MEHRIANASDQKTFIFGGKAVFTLKSAKTGTHYTYQIKASENGEVFFAAVLTGSNNEEDYSYAGIIRAGSLELRRTAKSKIGADAPSFKALAWSLRNLGSEALEFYHENKCCKCGRRLTHPESIATGIGPECGRRLQAAA